MPWKNGGGVTTEISVSPPGAGVADFDWRISMATVAEAGPFSKFPGVDRTLAILEGQGISLDVAGEGVTLFPRSAPYSFPADVPTRGAPIGGAIIDLNVMTRRGRFRHAVAHVTARDSARLRPAGSPSLLLSRSACVVSGAGIENPVAVEAGATLRFSAAPIGDVVVTGECPIDCYLIELFPI